MKWDSLYILWISYKNFPIVIAYLKLILTFYHNIYYLTTHCRKKQTKYLTKAKEKDLIKKWRNEGTVIDTYTWKRFWKSTWSHRWGLELNKGFEQRPWPSTRCDPCSHAWSPHRRHEPQAWPRRLSSPTQSSSPYPTTDEPYLQRYSTLLINFFFLFFGQVLINF